MKVIFNVYNLIHILFYFILSLLIIKFSNFNKIDFSKLSLEFWMQNIIVSIILILVFTLAIFYEYNRLSKKDNVYINLEDMILSSNEILDTKEFRDYLSKLNHQKKI